VVGQAGPSCSLMAVRLEHDILFNFAACRWRRAERLYEYARWFDAHGGARFIIHRGAKLSREFSRNEFVVARQSSASRVLRGVQAIGDVRRSIGTPGCYYAFGIPLQGRVGRVNCVTSASADAGVANGPVAVGDASQIRVLGGRP